MKVLFFLIFIGGLVQAQSFTPSAGSIYNLDSSWTDQNDRSFKLKAWSGRPVILAMTYASCKAACPLLVEDMKKIERNLLTPNRQDFLFVLVSFDSEKETPEKMKLFAQHRHLDLNRWVLVKSSSRSVREMAAALGVRYTKDATGNYQHSNMITVLDKQGVIKHQQIGLGGKNIETLEVIKRAL